MAAMVTDPLSPLSVAWILLCTFLVLSMQLGFAMLEVGSVRRAHRMTVLVKNIMDSCVSCIAFWAHNEWYSPSLSTDADGVRQYYLLLFYWTFCATSVTICSGSMAERTHMFAYLSYTVVTAGFIWPILAASAWGVGGFLHSQFNDRFHEGYKYHDFAGSGVVHFSGGCCALVGNFLLGRRIMRPTVLASAGLLHRPQKLEQAGQESLTFRDDAEDEDLFTDGAWVRRFDDPSRDAKEFVPASYLQVMGTFTLWIGWYGFNAGSTLSMDEVSARVVGTVVWNTSMAAGGGGLGSYITSCTTQKHLDAGFLCNGILAGLVSITASCDVAAPHMALLIGFLAGLLVFPVASRLMQACLLDDPVDAVPVHAACGLFGVLMVTLCRPECSVLRGGGLREEQRFCAPDYDMGRQFVAQLWGAFTILWWTLSWAILQWSVFLVSERARAMEVEHLEKAEELLIKIVTSEPDSEAATLWEEVARGSPIARGILRRHGWGEKGAVTFIPADIWGLRVELRNARAQRAMTALELEVPRPLLWLAKIVHACWPFRELAFLRLRIAPTNELSGLGAAGGEGGELFLALRRMMQANEEQGSGWSHSVLKRHVQELTLAVRSQEALMNSILRGRNWRRQSLGRSLESLPEQRYPPFTDAASSSTPPPSDAASSSATPTATSAAAARAPTSQPPPNKLDILPFGGGSLAVAAGYLHAAPHQASYVAVPYGSNVGFACLSPRSSDLSSGNRTRSENSAGAISLHSGLGGDDTPPPAIIGRARASRSRPPAHGSANMQDVHGQLMIMFQAQQQLISMALEQAASSSNSSSSGRTHRDHTSPGSSQPLQQDQLYQHQQQHMMLAALQHAAAMQLAGFQTPGLQGLQATGLPTVYGCPPSSASASARVDRNSLSMNSEPSGSSISTPRRSV